ncbi:hypothetical protein [Paractinoplanes rishiriensis]|uniref:Uncharacterized protein n=1 Tax=Paractinoplanes rishiriensis TaxID=1050105 RepID=A0A919N2I6_9ACTN|nr:hypothetical protein [Actinoplanes rishiriensis]GIF00328.1 hypothetical protein Ari01nite_77920 [Actinoplanes rishiriensis]
MDPTAADDEASDVAVADQSAADFRRGGRENDTLYRRPPAHPPAESTTGGSWFSSTADVAEPPDDDDYAQAASGTSARTSFGFSETPISPIRSSAREPGETSQARSGRSSWDGESGQVSQIGSGRSSWDGESGQVSQAGSGRSSWDREPGQTSTEMPARKRPAPPAARQAAPSAPDWPQPARLGPDQSTLDRVPGEGGTGDYLAWPNADYNTGERHQVRRETPQEARPRQSRGVTIGIAVLSLIVLFGGAAAGVVYYSSSNNDVGSVLELGAAGTAKQTATAPLDNRTTASFELLAGANSVKLTIGELGDDLYRISTPDDAGFKPSPVIRNDDVKLQVSRDGDGTGGEIEVVLAAKVRWALRFSGYAETQLIDVSGGQVSQIEMVAGMRRAEVTLARPTGTVPLKINGAVDQLVLKSPSNSPVRIKVGGGAQTVVAGSRTIKDVKAGSTLTPKGWNTANRYDVTAGARITALTIESA